MLQETTGMNAGNVWNALSENGSLNTKDLKKAAGLKNEKELLLALGWLLREDKISLTEEGKDLVVTLK